MQQGYKVTRGSNRLLEAFAYYRGSVNTAACCLLTQNRYYKFF